MKWTSTHSIFLVFLIFEFLLGICEVRTQDTDPIFVGNSTNWQYTVHSGSDWTSNSTNGILEEDVVTVTYNNTNYLSPQIVVQIALGSTNDTGNLTELEDPLHLVLSVQYWEEYVREVASWYITQINSTLMFNVEPTANNLTGVNMTYILTGFPTTNTTYYNITKLELDILKTELTLGKTINFDYPYCPGQRYIQANIDYGIFAFNMTFKAGSASFTNYYTELWLNFQTLANITSKNAAYVVDSSKVSTSDYYLIENILDNGVWWYDLQCKTTTSGSWSFTVKSVETCLLECFDHGTCVDTPAYCLCDTFWDGDDCQDVFKGVYTLIVLAVIVGVGLPSYIFYKVWQFIKDRDVDYEVLEDGAEFQSEFTPIVNSVNQDTHVWHRNTNGHSKHDYDEVDATEASPLLFPPQDD